MLKLIAEWLELAVKQIWLKHIDRAANKYNKLNCKATMQAYVVHELVGRYNEIYPGDKIKLEQKNGQNRERGRGCRKP